MENKKKKKAASYGGLIKAERETPENEARDPALAERPGEARRAVREPPRERRTAARGNSVHVRVGGFVIRLVHPVGDEIELRSVPAPDG